MRESNFPVCCSELNFNLSSETRWKSVTHSDLFHWLTSGPSWADTHTNLAPQRWQMSLVLGALYLCSHLDQCQELSYCFSPTAFCNNTKSLSGAKILFILLTVHLRYQTTELHSQNSQLQILVLFLPGFDLEIITTLIHVELKNTKVVMNLTFPALS